MVTSSRGQHRIDLLLYFLIGCAALVCCGLIYKVLFVFYNYAQFSSLSLSEISYALLWGVRFDLASAAFFSLLSCIVLWFYHRLLPAKNPAYALLLIMLVVQLSLQIADTLYFAEAGRHVSYEMRDVLADASGLFMTAITKHMMFILFAYLFVVAIILLVLNPVRRVISAPVRGVRLGTYRWHLEVKLLSVLLMSAIFLRGGVSGVPQSVISAFNIGDPQQAVIAMNGAYSVVYGALNSAKEIDRLQVRLPEQVDVETVMRAMYPEVSGEAFSENISDTAAIHKYNLVFILMEGWPADMMSAYGYEKQTTPFFDSLKEKAIAPRGVIAGGARTTEGIYATFCSQQNPLGKTVAQSSLQNNQYDCLPAILKKRGWHTAFFQGSHKETSGTGAFAQSLGFTESFAKEDMPQGRYPHNYWGAHDPDIYDFLLDHLDNMPQPFMVGLNTNSTHDIEVPTGVEPFFGDASSEQKHQSILRFADQAMQAFFEKIKQKPYYKNTVFVLMSDHTVGRHKTVAARYYIPGVIYAEDLLAAKTIDHYVSQRDFAPTVLDILGLPATPSFAGKSLLSEKDSIYFADYFDAGSIGWIEENALVETSITAPSEMKCYSIENSLINAYPVSCDEKYNNNSARSLVFTSYSQAMLFQGKTKMFLEFADR